MFSNNKSRSAAISSDESEHVTYVPSWCVRIQFKSYLFVNWIQFTSAQKLCLLVVVAYVRESTQRHGGRNRKFIADEHPSIHQSDLCNALWLTTSSHICRFSVRKVFNLFGFDCVPSSVCVFRIHFVQFSIRFLSSRVYTIPTVDTKTFSLLQRKRNERTCSCCIC